MGIVYKLIWQKSGDCLVYLRVTADMVESGDLSVNFLKLEVAEPSGAFYLTPFGNVSGSVNAILLLPLPS